jgi:hypothetical protein
MSIHGKACAAALLAGVLVACQDTPTQPLDGNGTAAFSRGGAHRGGDGFGGFEPLASSAACLAPPATLAAFDAYQPLVLPPGFTQKIIADELGDFIAVAGPGAGNPDMNTLNETGPHAGRYLFRTHEVGSNGAVTAVDLYTGAVSLIDQATHYEALDGIVWSPWGTLLFAEERIVASLKDPRVPNAVGGLVYEWDPRTRTTTPLPAVGPRSHEGLAFDKHGNLYGISESTPGSTGSGAIFKFVPDRRGNLSTGQLYALKVLNSATRTGDAVWVPLDRDLSEVNSDQAAINVGATGWARPEDIELTNSRGGSEVMFIPATGEDLVLRIELRGNRARVSNYVQEGVNVTGLNNPDNVAMDKDGTLYILEDNGPGDIWAVPRNTADSRGWGDEVAANVLLFASLSDCSGEPTGLYFDGNGKKAWVHVQHAGGTLRNDLLLELTRQR